MALFKVCSRTVCNRGFRPAFFYLNRGFSKKSYDKFEGQLEDAMNSVGGSIDKKPRKTNEQIHEELKSQLNDGQTITPEQKDKLEMLLSMDPAKTFDQFVDKDSEIETETVHVAEKGDLTEAEAEAAVKEFLALDKEDPNTDVNQSVPYREKVKASDLGESFGPAKAEFDSWKRIYAEEESFERLGLPPRAHYWRDGEMYSPFGTLSNPVKVYSQFSHRIVGCRGGNGQAHEIVWVNLGNKYKTMCPECGQMFMLVNYKPEEHERPYEQLHKIDKVQNDGQLKEPQMY